MDKYGLIGFPLHHSFSMSFFNEKFQNENIAAEYCNFEIPTIEHLPGIIAQHGNLRGLNVTIPYKEKVISYLDELSDEARTIGAVNVVKITRHNGQPYLKGFNSDIIGFTRSIEGLLKPHHRKALILGTGGASKAIRYGLEQLGLEYRFVSRREQPGMLTYEQITADTIREYEVIVNCTPCGMYPHCDEAPALPYEAMNENNLLYDLIYNPDQTLFMRKGAQAGAVTKNGLEMLLLQAYASWEFWHTDD